MNALIKTQGASFLPICATLIPPMGELIMSGNEEFEKIALYIFDDVIEFCGPEAGQTCVLFSSLCSLVFHLCLLFALL